MRRAVGTILIALTVVVLAVVVALVLDGDGGSGPDSPAAAGGTAPTTTTAVPATTTTAPRRGSGQPVTLAFGGDVHFEGNLRSQLLASPSSVLAPIKPVLDTADIAMVNLETAITEGGTPAPGKQYHFRAPASAFDALRAGGVDVVTMANNHGADYGAVGVADSLAARDAKGFPVLGIGANATEAYRPWRTTVRGQRIAVFGMTDVLDDWLIDSWTATDAQAGLASTKGVAQARAVAAVQEARRTSDTVVVFLHWGVEGATCPSPRQQELARALVDAGADVVVGSHAHRVEGGGHLGSAYVDYGLGNFVFYNESGLSGRSGVLRLTVTGRDVDRAEWLPARIQGGVARPLSGSTAAADVAQWEAQRGCTGLAP